MNYKIVTGIVILHLIAIAGFAQTARKYSNEFLNIGVGARALGMSNSYVASVNDVTAGYWNPAGLLNLAANKHQVGLMHSEYFAGIAKYDYAAYATRLDSTSCIAGSIIRFGVDGIPNTTDLIDNQGNIDYDRITTFSAADLGILLSYAKTLFVPGLKLGANVKIIRRRVGDFGGAWGFGFDAGAQYTYNKWHFGAILRDATSTFNAWSYSFSDKMIDVFKNTKNEIPANSLEITAPKLLTGVARKFDFTKDISLLAEVDIDATFDGMRNVLIKSKTISLDPHVGIEGSYRNIVFLRAGIGNYQHYYTVQNKRVATMQPNIGLGIRIKSFYLDYALTDIGDNSVAIYSNVFSVKFDINKK